MNLIYKNTQKEVKVGDEVTTFRGEKARVTFFRQPASPASSGKISIKMNGEDYENEYYVSVIGAEWINREDRAGE